ncbi:MAG: GAF domain-containing protein [Anaerolineales bacterium]|nr:GAF domain-containing protein [Anaerolineales bacterium]
MRARKLWLLFWPVASAVSVQMKIMAIVLVPVLLLGLGVTFQVRLSLQRALVDQLEKRGVSIARDLAARGTDLILTNNIFALHELVRDTVENNEDTRYVFILGADGEVLTHSFGQGFPQGLIEANPVAAEERFRLEVLDTEEGLIRDLAVPIFDSQAGIARVGMSEHHLRQAVVTATWQLLIATALVWLVSVVVSYFLTRVLIKPILGLVEATRAVARGDLSRKVVPWADDEIGQLGQAFNAMTADLEKSRRESEALNRQLLRRTRELSALYAIAVARSSSKDIAQVLKEALEQVLVAMGFKVGWICTLDQDSQRRTLVCWAGLWDQVAPREAAVDLSVCNCKEVFQAKRPVVICPLPATCPVLGVDLGEGKRITCHAIIPLISRPRVLWVLNVASHDQFSDQDLQLLVSIGKQMGIVIENARLWEELKRTEELRGQLLKKVITAQEEERKRIARELHDETSQALTSLIVQLKVLEEAGSLTEAQAHIKNLRAAAAKTLEEVHNLALEIRPSVLDDLGLVAALWRYLRGYEGKFRLPVDFQVLGLGGQRLPSQVETALYRIVQEALINVARHARAQSVSLLLENRGSSVVLIVEDDGRGFDVARVMGSHLRERNLGLYGMQERASLLGGTVTIESTPGAGTAVFVEIPLERGENEEDPFVAGR